MIGQLVNFITYKQISVAGLIGYIFPRFLFILLEFVLFLVIISLKFDIKLSTKVTQYEQVFIIAIDSNGREVFSLELIPSQALTASGHLRTTRTTQRSTMITSSRDQDHESLLNQPKRYLDP